MKIKMKMKKEMKWWNSFFTFSVGASTNLHFLRSPKIGIGFCEPPLLPSYVFVFYVCTFLNHLERLKMFFKNQFNQFIKLVLNKSAFLLFVIQANIIFAFNKYFIPNEFNSEIRTI